MDIKKLHSLLNEVQAGQVSVEAALAQLRDLPYTDDLDYARLDLHRALRQGLPEVIFCQSKTTEQVVGIMTRLSQHHERILGTRATVEMAEVVQAHLPEVHYDSTSRLLKLEKVSLSPLTDTPPTTLVVSGGTADMPVAEEAAQTVEFLGGKVERVYDVGVAGIHRLLDQRAKIFAADVVISVAGMEGALTSVVGGLAACPVIGVPTSVGYGASFDGVAALLAMLNSCSSGIAVVNIDNGFGAGFMAYRILQRIEQSSKVAK